MVFGRLLNLKKTFKAKYGEVPLFYAFAPGRVNLIGGFKDPIDVFALKIIIMMMMMHELIYFFNEYQPYQCVCFMFILI